MIERGILILGGSGYVGQALLPHLLATGRQVHVVARHRVPLPNVPNLIAHWTALDDVSMLRAVLPHCQCVVHCASDSTPGSSANHPALETELNIMPTLRFLDLLQEYGGIHLIFLSSGGTIYGNPAIIPVKESCPLAPISFHGAGKVAIEAFLQSYSNRLARSVTILRPSNLYGPGQPYRQGFGLIRTILEHLRRDSPVEIWGDGEIVRDYIYIEDFMKVCIGFITRQDTINATDIFNVGSGKGYSINDLCNIIASVTGREIQRNYCPSRAIDVKAVILDCSKLSGRIGWQPDTDIMHGMSLTWQWLQGQPS